MLIEVERIVAFLETGLGIEARLADVTRGAANSRGQMSVATINGGIFGLVLELGCLLAILLIMACRLR